MAYKLKKKNGKHVLVRETSPMEMKPSLSLTEKDLPAIKNWKVGKEYDITVHVKQISMSQGEMYGPSEGSKSIHARFEILSAKEAA